MVRRAPLLNAVAVALTIGAGAWAAIAIAACSSSEDPEGSVAEPPPTVFPDGAVIPTWTRDIAPLLAKNCMGCHEGGTSGPFTLKYYEDVKPRHLAIRDAVNARRMPPWLPDEGCQTWRGERRLTQAEIDLVTAWSAAGAPLGDAPATTPAVTPRLEVLGAVDREIQVATEYVPQEGKLDEPRCFVLDPQITEDVDLAGYDIAPTRRSAMLRAVLIETALDEARAKDDADPLPGWACSESQGIGTNRVVGRWASAFGAVTFPQGAGLSLRKGYGLVLQVNYHVHESGHGTGVVGAGDRTKISLQFAKTATTRKVEFVHLPAPLTSVPPRTTGYSLSSSVAFPEGGTIWALEPRMHLLGKQFHVALDPEGQKTCLLGISKWNYHWEEMHFLAGAGIAVPPGGNVGVRCVWDNPTDVARLPGPGLDDETCELSLIVTRP